MSPVKAIAAVPGLLLEIPFPKASSEENIVVLPLSFGFPYVITKSNLSVVVKPISDQSKLKVNEAVVAATGFPTVFVKTKSFAAIEPVAGILHNPPNPVSIAIPCVA